MFGVVDVGRIAESFSALRANGGKGFIPFITAGDPDLDTTEDLLVELSEAGATLIELGVPFSDPMADGPVIQRASERALKHGFGLAAILETVAAARAETNVPIVLFSYLNPLLQFGPEEAVEFSGRLKARGLDMIFLVAPTSTDARLKMIVERASGFIYAVSRAGV